MFTWKLNKSETGPEYKRVMPSNPAEWDHFMGLMCKVRYVPSSNRVVVQCSVALQMVT
jgi:hypothetical protein